MEVFNGKSQYYLLNDLWKLNMNTGQWTWLKGSLTSKESIVSDIGVEDPNNLPNTLDWSLDNPNPNHWVIIAVILDICKSIHVEIQNMYKFMGCNETKKNYR